MPGTAIVPNILTPVPALIMWIFLVAMMVIATRNVFALLAV
jgi:hypothetical protein